MEFAVLELNGSLAKSGKKPDRFWDNRRQLKLPISGKKYSHIHSFVNLSGFQLLSKMFMVYEPWSGSSSAEIKLGWLEHSQAVTVRDRRVKVPW